MRILILILISFFTVSCDLDYKDDDVSFEKIQILSVEVASEMTVGQQYAVSFEYGLPNSCRDYYNVELDIPSENTRTVTAYAEVSNNENCSEIYEIGTDSFIFKPEDAGIYIIKFWTGVNESGEDEFESYEITISE